MKRYLLFLFAALFAVPVSAQFSDSLLRSRNIFDLLSTSGPYGNRVEIVQQESLRGAVQRHVIQNESKQIQGYRIRIFSSNAQTARAMSQAAKEEFEALFPSIRAYLRFGNPDYRVTVGDFRTKSEAVRFLNELKALRQYNRVAVVVREAIEFPAL
jgi:orotidine-5'-phosphate decarboxylase